MRTKYRYSLVYANKHDAPTVNTGGGAGYKRPHDKTIIARWGFGQRSLQ